MDPQIYPYLAGLVGAIAGSCISLIKERRSGKTLDLEYVRGLIDEQIEDLRTERDKSRSEMVKLRERIAVMESHLRAMEQRKNLEIAQLREENQGLRRLNAKLAAENVQFKARLGVT